MVRKQILSLAILAGVLCGSASVFYIPTAEAGCWFDKHGRRHCDNGVRRGHRTYFDNGRYYYDDRRRSFFDTKTGKIVKGSLIGAGVGAGSAIIFDKSVGKSAVLGAGIGAGVQALRYSRFLDRRD